MGVRIRKRRGIWYVFVNYQGRRKAKCVGTRDAAEKVKKILEAKLALGDLGFMSEGTKQLTFEEYADKWLNEYAKVHCKTSTSSGYGAILDLYLRPKFGTRSLNEIRRAEIKSFLADLSLQTKQSRKKSTEPDAQRPTLSRG